MTLKYVEHKDLCLFLVWLQLLLKIKELQKTIRG